MQRNAENQKLELTHAIMTCTLLLWQEEIISILFPGDGTAHKYNYHWVMATAKNPPGM
jgi:hypothetical protein